MMMKKGQAAMEFLMTYGWAILVVLAAIGALAYFGVLSPNSMLPERTTFQAPLPAIDNAVVSLSGTNATIAFKNNKGNAIEISATGMAGTEDCQTVTIAGVRDATGDMLTASTSGAACAAAGTGCDIPNGDTFIVEFECGTFAPGSTGERFESDLSFSYVDLETGLSRPHQGTVQAKVTA